MGSRVERSHVMVYRRLPQGGGVLAQPQLALPIDVKQQGQIGVYRVTLPFLPPSKNVYDGWPGQWKSSAKKKWVRNLLDQFESVQLPKGAQKVGLSAALVFPTKAHRDIQNYANCLWHWVPDALQTYGCIANDTPEYVEFGPNLGIQFMVDARGSAPKAKRQRTHLSIAVQMP